MMLRSVLERSREEDVRPGVMDETTSDRLGDDTGRRGSRRCMTSLQA